MSVISWSSTMSKQIAMPATTFVTPLLFAVPRFITSSVVPGVYSRWIRSIRPGRELPPERAVGHVLAERHRMLLVVVVDDALARLPEQ
jgi:hypothetical protein